MGTPAQIGKLQYNAALHKARQTNINMRQIMKRLMNEAPNHLIKALVGQLAMELGENDAVIHELEQMGKTLKEVKKSG